MIDPSLASLSDSLFSVTVALYSLAVVAFCAELAFGARTAPARELVAAGDGRVVPPQPPAGGRSRRRPLAPPRPARTPAAADGASSPWC